MILLVNASSAIPAGVLKKAFGWQVEEVVALESSLLVVFQALKRDVEAIGGGGILTGSDQRVAPLGVRRLAISGTRSPGFELNGAGGELRSEHQQVMVKCPHLGKLRSSLRDRDMIG